MKIVWCIVSEILSTTESFVILGHFSPFELPNNPKNENFEKMKISLELLSFYTCVQQMTVIWQHSKFALAVGKCGEFCRGMSIFFNIWKRYFSKNKKMFFLFKKKRNVLLNNFFCFSHDFQTWFYDAGHVLCYPEMSVFSFHTFVVLLYQLRNNT